MPRIVQPIGVMLLLSTLLTSAGLRQCSKGCNPSALKTTPTPSPGPTHQIEPDPSALIREAQRSWDEFTDEAGPEALQYIGENGWQHLSEVKDHFENLLLEDSSNYASLKEFCGVLPMNDLIRRWSPMSDESQAKVQFALWQIAVDALFHSTSGRAKEWTVTLNEPRPHLTQPPIGLKALRTRPPSMQETLLEGLLQNSAKASQPNVFSREPVVVTLTSRQVLDDEFCRLVADPIALGNYTFWKVNRYASLREYQLHYMLTELAYRNRLKSRKVPCMSTQQMRRAYEATTAESQRFPGGPSSAVGIGGEREYRHKTSQTRARPGAPELVRPTKTDTAIAP